MFIFDSSYPLRKGDRITLEYVLLKDVNDSLTQAKDLVSFMEGIPCKVNLIPFNPWPGSSFSSSSRNQTFRFKNELESKGIEAPIRVTRGQDIMGACGQLKSDYDQNKQIGPN